MLRHKIGIFFLMMGMMIVNGLQADGCGIDGCDCGDDCCCAQNCYLYRTFPCDPRPRNCDPDSQKAYDCGYCGTWLPEDPVLFRPFVADPRQLTYSVGWRFNDTAMTKNLIPVSFWDTIPFYRWFGVWPYCGMFQIELDGGLWACFDPCTESAPLVNADYYGGLAVSYAFQNWSFRMRFYHISSHIGDEYLLNHPRFRRRNPSAETLDFFFSNDLTNEIRYYAGASWVVHCDESFRPGRLGLEAGCELRLPGYGFVQSCTNFCGYPYYGMHFRYWNNYHKHLDQTYVLGYEFTKCCGLRRKLRFFIEYHDGYSVEGQFSREPTTYFAIRTSYGY